MNAQSFKRVKAYVPRTAKILGLAMAMCAGLLLGGQSAASTATQDSFIANTSELQWEQWEGFPKGAEIAVINGDQNSTWDEAFVRVPAGFLVPHHHHTPRELVLWIQGTFTFVADDGTSRELGPTAYLSLASGNKHSVRCGDESPCLLYLKYDRAYDVQLHPEPGRVHAH